MTEFCYRHIKYGYISRNPFITVLASAGNSPVPAQRSVTRSFDVFFDLRLNKRLNKQLWGWWFETLSRPLWRHSNVPLPLSLLPINWWWQEVMEFLQTSHWGLTKRRPFWRRHFERVSLNWMFELWLKFRTSSLASWLTINPQSHRGYDHVTTYIRPQKDELQLNLDRAIYLKSRVIVRTSLVAATSIFMFKTLDLWIQFARSRK